MNMDMAILAKQKYSSCLFDCFIQSGIKVPVTKSNKTKADALLQLLKR